MPKAKLRYPSYRIPFPFDEERLRPRFRRLAAEARQRLYEHLRATGRSAFDDDDEATLALLCLELVTQHDRQAVAEDRPLFGGDRDSQRIVAEFLATVVHPRKLGILQPLLDDPRIEEIVINRRRVLVYFGGVEEKAAVSPDPFDDHTEVEALIQGVAAERNQTFDRNRPELSVQMPDGSRLSACGYDVATNGGFYVTIRKFLQRPVLLAQAVESGVVPDQPADFLRAALLARVAMIVTGGTGSGKTTFLSILLTELADERVIVLEQTPELPVLDSGVEFIPLQTSRGNSEGAGVVSLEDLVRLSLRMRPDRIVIGEVRGGEAYEMLKAMNTGHEGGLCTVHANSCGDSIDRLVQLAQPSGVPVPVLREMVVGAFGLVVKLDRVGGRRGIGEIYEIDGYVDGVLTGKVLWRRDGSGRLVGTGLTPERTRARIADAGIAYTWPGPSLDRGGAR